MSRHDTAILRNQLVLMRAIKSLVSSQRKLAGEIQERIHKTQEALGDYRDDHAPGEAWGPGSGNW